MREKRLNNILILNAVVLCAVLALFAGCSSGPVQDERQVSQKPLIWPSPPEPARISYLQIIAKPQDIGAGKGFFKKLGEFLFGGINEEMVKPYGVTVDSSGRLIVADTAFKKVHIFDIKDKSYSSISEAGGDALELPIAVAVDADDNIYVSESFRSKVLVFNRKGKFLYGFEAGKRPTGIAINKADKTLYVSDTGSHDVKVYTLKGKLIKTIGKWGAGPGEFNYPVDIFIDKAGEVYVVDSMNFRVQIFDKDGKFLSMFGQHGDGSGDFGRPKGIAVDSEGHIYVADALFDNVQIFDRKGRFLLNFGSIGRTPGSFWLPCGVYIDGNDKIYVSDSYNRRVQVFEYLGGGQKS